MSQDVCDVTSKEYDFLADEEVGKAKAKRARLRSLALGLKRKATSSITLGDRRPINKRPTLLGPILSNRFGDPTSSSRRT